MKEHSGSQDDQPEVHNKQFEHSGVTKGWMVSSDPVQKVSPAATAKRHDLQYKRKKNEVCW